jgi:penicillin-binding protein 2
MQPGYRIRLYLLTALVLTGFGVLVTRLYEFQIKRQDEFGQKIPPPTTVTVREPGVRGEITDRNGIPLARNLRNYEISFNLKEIRDAFLARPERKPGDEELDIVDVVNDWTIARLTTLKLARNYNSSALRTHFKTHKGLVPFSYRSDVTYEEFARCAEANLNLPGVYLNTRPLRDYPYGALASHVLGYVQPWRPGEIPEEAKQRFKHYVGDAKGADGVELSMDAVLQGPEGIKTLLKDEKGQIVSMNDYTQPGIGARLALTLEARSQLHVETVLRRVGRAAAVVMDVNTGEVIAMASVPDYNPNDFIPSISATRWNDYLANQKMDPFSNRCIKSFAPGSTFKPATAIAGALKGIADRTFSCDGYIAFGNIQIKCWLYRQSHSSHGALTLSKAIQISCNPFFMKMANSIGVQAMAGGMRLVGLGKTTGIELPGEDPGIIPGSQEWRMANPDKNMTPALNAMLAIGQGDAMATPLQLCAMVACIANGGKYYQPRIVKSATAPDGRKLIQDQPKLVTDLLKSGVAPEDLDALREGMRRAVNKPGGTASRVKISDIEVAAKTGTAQTVDDGKKSNNSWVLAFAPFEKPKYAVCVLVQNGGSGGKVCGPLAHLILRGLFAQDEGIRFPLKLQIPVVGNTDRVEEILLPKDDPLAAIVAVEDEAAGDTGEELEIPDAAPPALASEPVTPTPVVTPEADAGGTVIPPRAIIIDEP